MAGAVVALMTLAISVPLCVATIAFFVVYRLAEDYLLVPRVIGHAVQVPALVTIVAVLIGGALLGIVGALVAIPAATALQLLVREITIPRLDEKRSHSLSAAKAGWRRLLSGRPTPDTSLP